MLSLRGKFGRCAAVFRSPCMGVILIKLCSGFVEIALLFWCSPVGLLHALRASSLENTSGRLLLNGDNIIYNF